MKTRNKLYSAETLTKAGIPMYIVSSGERNRSIVNLRMALCFALVVEMKQPQIYVASLLNISQSSVSQNLKRHYELYNHDENYTEIYDSALKSIKKYIKK